MNHFASRAFWEAYDKLPEQVRALADKNYALLKTNLGIPRCSLKRSAGFGRCAWACAIAHWRSRLTTI